MSSRKLFKGGEVACMKPRRKWMDAEAACSLLSKGDLPNTCVVAGPDASARARVIARLREVAGVGAGGALLTVLSGDEVTQDSIHAALDALTFLGGGRRVVHVRHAEAVAERVRSTARQSAKSSRANRPGVGRNDERDATPTGATKLPRGHADALLIWETELPPAQKSAQGVQVVDALAESDDTALLIDCTVGLGPVALERVRAAAVAHGVRVSDSGLQRLAVIAATAPGMLDTFLPTLASYLGGAEATADDLETLARESWTDAGELLRRWSTAIQERDADSALRLWAEAGGSRGDPASLVAFLGGGLLAGIERGYSFAASSNIVAACALDSIRWADDCLKSSRGDRESVAVALLLHLAGEPRNAEPNVSPAAHR
jgi:hypothetical protein